MLTVYRARDFDHAFDIMRSIYDYMGDGHSCGIYSEDEAHIRRLGLEMTVCRVIVKQAHAVRQRRQLRQRAAVLAVDGLRHLGRQQLL